MSDASNDTQLWRVVVACDEAQPHTHVREVEVYHNHLGWFTRVATSIGLATPRAAVMEHAAKKRWPVAEILAPGQSSRAEVERERDALHARREDQEAACRGHMAVCRLYEQRAETLRAEGDALHAVVAALPRCTRCDATATREAPNLGDQYYCDDHAPAQPWTTVDLPYAAEVRAWRGTR